MLTINVPHDASFKLLMNTVNANLFDDLVTNFIKDSTQIYGGCVEFDLDNLPSIIQVLGTTKARRYEGLLASGEFDLSDDPKLFDYPEIEQASNCFKGLLNDCVHYIGHYFEHAAPFKTYCGLMVRYNCSVQGCSGYYYDQLNEGDRFICVMLDLLVLAFLLKHYHAMQIDRRDALSIDLINWDGLKCEYYTPAIYRALEAWHAFKSLDLWGLGTLLSC